MVRNRKRIVVASVVALIVGGIIALVVIDVNLRTVVYDRNGAIEGGLTVSPDGKSVVVCIGEGKGSRVVRCELSTGTLTTIYRSDKPLSYPSYTPTGDSLFLFVDVGSGRSQRSKLEFASRKLSEVPDSDRLSGLAEISADGKRGLLIRSNSANRGGFVGEVTSESKLYLVDIETGKERQLTSQPSVKIYSPSFMPGTNFAICSAQARGSDTDLWKIDLATGRESTLYSPPDRHSASDPTCSPDGKLVAFISDLDVPYDYNVYQVDVNGGNLKRLTTKAKRASFPTFLPDSKRLVCIVNNSEVWLHDSATDSSVRLFGTNDIR